MLGTLASAAVFVTAALAVAPSTGSAHQPATGAPALPAHYTQQKPAWQPCKADAPDHECATVHVPLDYRRPAEAAITVAISRIRATAPERRRGILLFNPGGPGAEGIDWPVLMRGKLPEDVTEQYDLIGFDPRGVGASSPVSCPAFPSGRTVARPETFDLDLAEAREYAEKCAQSHPTIPHVTTRNTARDMDLIRAVLGERKLSYFGLSYGTYLGAVYTQLFPHRTDRIVLDSAIDPALAWRGHYQAAAVNVEAAFRRWTRWAADRDATYHLGATPAAVSKTFWDLVTQADVTPIKIDGETFTGGDIRSNAEYDVFFLRRQAERVVELRKAAETPAGATRRAADIADQTPELEPAGGTAILCNDARWPRDPQIYRRDALRDMKRYPISGYGASNIFPCAFWTNPYAEPATTVRNNVPALIVQNEWDWATPARPAYALHRAMRGSRFLLVDEGEGHGVYGNGSSCADAVVNTYLSTGELPQRNEICKAPPPAQESPAG
jgi:pimeloyl-ACP methyl ester carboxylesterase